jgi:ketosteroid isomerase-like protein
MRRYAVLSAAMLCLTVPARADDEDARRVAQEVLDEGAALFDARDAAALAASYTPDAEIGFISQDKESRGYKTQAIRGRQAIETWYGDLFKNAQGGPQSRNHVEFAHFIRPDLLAIHGHFQPDVNKEGDFPFIQVRANDGDRWLLMSLQLFLVPGK